MEKEFKVWSEGYIATGERCTAEYHGIFTGETFKDAVRKYIARLEPKSQTYYKERGDDLSFWGCRFFDNEADARKKYG